MKYVVGVICIVALVFSGCTPDSDDDDGNGGSAAGGAVGAGGGGGQSATGGASGGSTTGGQMATGGQSGGQLGTGGQPGGQMGTGGQSGGQMGTGGQSGGQMGTGGLPGGQMGTGGQSGGQMGTGGQPGGQMGTGGELGGQMGVGGMAAECAGAADCLPREWPIDCTGHWECQEGRCQPVADCGQERGCGDDTCDPGAGESRQSCGIDCQCDAPIDCIGGPWPVRCMGRWVCQEQRCEADACGVEGGCGDEVCEPELGEGPRSCGVDCAEQPMANCRIDEDCPVAERCDECAASSCPGCDDCIALCVPHDCETAAEPRCDQNRPQCDQGFVAVVRQGCWDCVSLVTCEEADDPGGECVPDGGRRAVIPNAPPCCEGLRAISCDRPSAETGGECRRGCVGAAYCTACGDGECGEGENDCNCAEDCAEVEPPQDCVPEGGRRAVIPNAPPCCEGLRAISCDRPSAETGGECRRGCVGAAFCTACGDGQCGDGENDCNCAEDCGP